MALPLVHHDLYGLAWARFSHLQRRIAAPMPKRLHVSYFKIPAIERQPGARTFSSTHTVMCGNRLKISRPVASPMMPPPTMHTSYSPCSARVVGIWPPGVHEDTLALAAPTATPVETVGTHRCTGLVSRAVAAPVALLRRERTPAGRQEPGRRLPRYARAGWRRSGGSDVRCHGTEVGPAQDSPVDREPAAAQHCSGDLRTRRITRDSPRCIIAIGSWAPLWLPMQVREQTTAGKCCAEVHS